MRRDGYEIALETLTESLQGYRHLTIAANVLGTRTFVFPRVVKAKSW